MGVPDFLAEVLVLLDEVLHLPLDAVVLGVVLLDALLVFGEFLEGLGLLGVGQTDILLGVPDFVSETGVLLEEFLDLLLEDFAFLVVVGDSVLVVVEFFDDLLVLLCRKSKILLSVSDFIAKSLVLSNKSLNSLLK